jgi:hypothetical protein
VLHAAEWKSGNHDEIVFAEGESAIEMLRHVARSNFDWRTKEAKAIGGDGAEESGGEGEQVRGEGKCIGCLTELGIDEFERACGAAC